MSSPFHFGDGVKPPTPKKNRLAHAPKSLDAAPRRIIMTNPAAMQIDKAIECRKKLQHCLVPQLLLSLSARTVVMFP